MSNTYSINLPANEIVAALVKAQTDVATTSDQGLVDQQKLNARENIEALGSGDLADYAQTSGIYPDMAVGSASAVPFSGVSDLPSTLDGYGIEDAYTKTEIDSNFAGMVTDTVSGSIAAFIDGAGDNAMMKVVAENGTIIYRTGTNIWDEVWELGTIDVTTGSNANSSTNIRSKNYIPVVPNTQYYSTIDVARFYYDENQSYLFMESGQLATTPDSAHFMRIRTPKSYGTTYNNDISLNYPSTDTAYHAYTGSSFEITAGVSAEVSTYYGANNIWANTGDVSVTYPIDTKLYIDNKINAIMAAIANL